MEPMWELAIPLLDHVSLIVLSFLVCGIWALFSRYWSHTQVAAKTETSTHSNNHKQIKKLTVSQLKDSRKNFIESDPTSISGLPMGWNEGYILWSIDKSLERISQHLENASSTVIKLSLSESDSMSTTSISDTVAQEILLDHCYCKNGKRSTHYSISLESSNNSSILSSPSIFSELTPKEPCSATDSIKVTPMALSQVMEAMGMIPDSQSEVADSAWKIKAKTNLSQPPYQAETVSIPPKSSNPVITSLKAASPEHQMRDSRPNPMPGNSKLSPVALFHNMDSRGLINERVIQSAGLAPRPQHQVMESEQVDTLHKDEAVEPAKMSPEPPHTVFKARERILQPQHKVMDSGSQNQATKQIRFTPRPLQRLWPPPKVLDSSTMIPKYLKKSMSALKINSVVQESAMGVITPLLAGLTAQSVAQTKESLELPSVPKVQVRDSIGMTPCQGTEYVSLTPKLPHQVMNPLEFTPRHQDLDCSEVSPRQNHKMTEPMGLTSDTWPQKNPTEMTQTESMTTALGALDQGTVPIGMSQTEQLKKSEVVPATSVLNERLGPFVWAPLHLSPLVRGELNVSYNQQD
ncbi:uncharacterized protein LOC143433879 [Arvicanthis niloticus]|uniref:uncharacterized protein LOC143433879 n=1 Tax=Arvicanthis niloticus TaxID=61156 RepID=UPI00402B56B2